MKKILLMLSLVLLVLLSCTKNLDDYNLDTKSAQQGEAPAETLVSNAQIGLARILANPNVNYNIFRLLVQHWTETTYTDESNYNLVTRTIPDNFWAVLYRDVLRDLKEAKDLVEKTDPKFTDPAVIKNRLAIIDALEVYTYATLVNTFGNIPYAEALDISNPTPKYDDAATIYADLLKRLDEDLANLTEGQESYGSADVYYKGNVTQWKMFTNSLKLKLGITLADADPAKAKAAVETAAPNVFQSEADRTTLKFMSAPPNTNPIWVDLIQSKRKDFVIANTLVDKMNELEDPRRPQYFTKVGDNYKGGVYGAQNNYASFSKVSAKITDPEFESMLMDYVETEFYLAEAVERGYQVPGTAAEHYTNAIRSSIIYWGATQAEADAYLAKPEVAYATAAGDFKQRIGTQKWIALFNRGFEAWTEWRRLDAPKLVPPPTTTKPIPLRFSYPINEQKLNSKQYEAAAIAIGGDKTITRLFWDKQ
ncbi:MAG: SusD/RagB family nutrient-binding outer membrane lipoprotein [Sphingobacteriaceae bacterium]